MHRPGLTKMMSWLCSRLEMRTPSSAVSSSHKGITWNSTIGKWIASVWNTDLKIDVPIGSFATEEEVCYASCKPIPNAHSSGFLGAALQI